jgi:hypothetical protein
LWFPALPRQPEAAVPGESIRADENAAAAEGRGALDDEHRLQGLEPACKVRLAEEPMRRFCPSRRVKADERGKMLRERGQVGVFNPPDRHRLLT